MTNEELVELIQQGVDVKENLGLLYVQNKGLIYKLALPYSKGSDMEDLMQEAYFGLETATTKFNPKEELKFMTYARFWIKTTIRRYALANSRTNKLPEHMINLMFKYHKYKNEYSITNKAVEPTDEEYKTHLGISQKQLDNLRKVIFCGSCLSIDNTIIDTDKITLGDTLTDNFNLEEDVVDRLNGETEKQIIWCCVSELSDRQQRIIKCRFKDNMLLKEIAEADKVSPELIRQLEKKALNLLKKNEKLIRLSEQYGYDSQHNYKSGFNRFKNTNTSSTEYMALKRIGIEKDMRNVQNRQEVLDEILNWRIT